MVAFASACGAQAAGSDGGTGGADVGASCFLPARECPEEPPLPGSPCEGMLSCPYGTGGMGTCAGGVWLYDPGCDGGCAPPLAEVCRDPFTGALSGAVVEIGPVDGAFRPFSDHEPITAVYGGQGGAMINYRVRIDGMDVPADCIEVSASVVYDAMAPVSSRHGVVLHCDQTLGIFEVLPDRPCESRIYPVTMTVEVAGIGETSVTLDLMGGMCPREL